MQPKSGSRDSVTPSGHADVINELQHGFSSQLPTQPQGPIIPPKPPQVISDRKFNVVMYGIEESPPSTPKVI